MIRHGPTKKIDLSTNLWSLLPVGLYEILDPLHSPDDVIVACGVGKPQVLAFPGDPFSEVNIRQYGYSRLMQEHFSKRFRVSCPNHFAEFSDVGPGIECPSRRETGDTPRPNVAFHSFDIQDPLANPVDLGLYLFYNLSRYSCNQNASRDAKVLIFSCFLPRP